MRNAWQFIDMVVRRLLPFAVMACLILHNPAVAGEPASDSTAAAKAGDKPAAAKTGASKTAKRQLEKDMTGETIRSIIGTPDEITPMKSKEGRAETWIYRRKIGTKAVQVAIGEREVPAFSGLGGTGNDMNQSRKELIYGLKHVAIYRVTSILMFNDHLVTARQTDELSEKYE